MMSTGFLKTKLPMLLFLMPVTRNLPVFAGIFSVKMSWLHLIMPPLRRLMCLVIVTVALMKEPLLKVTCAVTSEESSIRFNLTVALLIKKGKDTLVEVEISQFRNPNSVVHQNTISSEHVAPLPLT